jgi:hypothetical protein
MIREIYDINLKIIQHINQYKNMLKIDDRDVYVFDYVQRSLPKDTDFPCVIIDSPQIREYFARTNNGGDYTIEFPIHCCDKNKPESEDDKLSDIRVCDLSLNLSRILNIMEIQTASGKSYEWLEIEEIQNKVKNLTLILRLKTFIVC